MAEMDFASLRAQVEAATRLPDFGDVRRRARRARLRDRMATAGALLATLLVFTPVTVAAMRTRPGGDTPLGLNPPDGPVADPTPSLTATGEDRPMTFTLRAAGGFDLDHVYLAVDVCNGPAAKRRCALQISQVSGAQGGGKAPISSGTLRQSPTDPLGNIQLISLSYTSLLVGGSPADRARTYLRVGVDGQSGPVAEPVEALDLGPADRMAQLRDFGEVYGVKTADGRLSLLPSQPALAQTVPVMSIAPELGWWVTGHDRTTGALAVAVSHDQGATWTTSRLGVPAGLDAPTIATYDGIAVYAFVRGTDGVRQVRSTDRGQTWTEVKAGIPWPAPLAGPGALAGRAFGALVRAGGSLLMWIDDETAPVFVESTDRGSTYRAVSGPRGHVVAVPGGYVALSNPPALSRDAQTWIDAARPAIQPVN